MSRPDSELRSRWTAESAHQAIDLLRRGQPASPFGKFEGRVDLRGIAIDEPTRIAVGERLSRIAKLFTFERVTIGNVDFSYASLPEWRVSDTAFDHCVFDHARLISFRAYSAKFQRCSFRSAALKDAALGASSGVRRPGGEFDECDFQGADLRGISTDPGLFARCNFQESKWKGTRFLSTVLEYCDFGRAIIEGAFFDGRAFSNNSPIGLGSNKLKGCDLSRAVLKDTSFLSIDFRNCTPPQGPEFILIDHYPRMIEDALSYLKGQSGRDASVAVAILGAEAQSAKFLPNDALGLLQLEHYPGGSRDLIMRAFGVRAA